MCFVHAGKVLWLNSNSTKSKNKSLNEKCQGYILKGWQHWRAKMGWQVIIFWQGMGVTALTG